MDPVCESYRAYERHMVERMGVKKADGLHIAELPAPIGRGVIAEAPIKAKTTLVSVPLSATMSLQSADASIKAALNVFKSMGIDANEDDVLALMLLREKYVLGDRSKWAVHIASLPDTVHSPFFFTEEEMEAFKPCNFYNLATRIRTQTAASYEQIVKVLAAMGKEAPITPAHFTLPAFQWATGMVWSRFMSLKTMGSQVLKHMVPFVDMFNHSPTSMVHHSFDFVTKTISVVSDQPWDAGKQVFLNYGEASNMRLLQLHGFVLPKADLESYGLEINLPLELPSFEKRINMIKEYASFASMPSPLLLAEIEARAGVRAGEEASSEAAVKLDRWKAFVGTMVRYSTGAGITVELFKGVPHLGLLRIMRILHCPDELLVELGHTMRRSPDEGLGIEEEANMLQSLSKKIMEIVESFGNITDEERARMAALIASQKQGDAAMTAITERIQARLTAAGKPFLAPVPAAAGRSAAEEDDVPSIAVSHGKKSSKRRGGKASAASAPATSTDEAAPTSAGAGAAAGSGAAAAASADSAVSAGVELTDGHAYRLACAAYMRIQDNDILSSQARSMMKDLEALKEIAELHNTENARHTGADVAGGETAAASS